ncbi:MAG: SMC-Scp complex subunit ScpB [Alphaproteobacteria bacterium]|jgi:segregation and condensation protein B|nr:SMC-Scp complex subunit ScpB [Alphaproteobacteria bacterium]MDP7221806.1 SMC-Scp complex subunit ScpB [Alphaproteobacteria bacterium]
MEKNYDNIHNMRAIEAMLFASAEPIHIRAIRDRIGDDADVGGLLMELQKHYETRGINLVEIDNCWAFRTAEDVADILSVEKEVQRKLSRAAMETLSIVAYHQPVTRAEIENIRGVATSRGTLDVLMEAEWVKPGRRRETPGRPVTWVTTTAFLDQFGLEALTDLPGLDELKASGLLDRRPAIETIPGTGDLFDDDLPDEEDDEDDHVDDDTFDSNLETDEDEDN